ncbi:CCA tRNA nucleotidyltransferase [Magnetofaba australis]|uniref:Putative metal dependent phosphohydrolase n=1 Tax=Magnetofaba australis IT-1 TaxID=1434232 RepID=A0A1Y2K5X3_9PROT|nr:CCA tRNA nucleotidyltransferase [Magnetofaba australis]OSM05029.1 putative metal dependent phosphohydrolase [Magnetofaba australis IT-1]
MTLALRNGFSPFVQNLLDDLNWIIGPIHLVGGGLRNALQHHFISAELDILVDKPLEECRRLLLDAGYSSAVMGGKENQLLLPLKRRENPQTIQISRLRARPGVTPNVGEDLAHRDITVNAMAYCWPDGPLVDPFNGRQDLSHNRIRLVNGVLTLANAPLRAIRFFRFTIQLGGDPIPEDLTRCAETDLTNVRGEWLRGETDRIFSLPLQDERSRQILFDLFSCTLGRSLLPELWILKQWPEQPGAEQSAWKNTLLTMLHVPHAIDGEEFSALDLRWAALLHQLGKPQGARYNAQGDLTGYGGYWDNSARIGAQVLERLQFSKRRQRRILNIIQYLEVGLSPTERTLRRLAQSQAPLEAVFRLNYAKALSADDLTPEARAGVDEEYQRAMRRCSAARRHINRLQPTDLALSGGEMVDIVRAAPGPWISRLQSYLVDWVSEDPKRNKKPLLADEVRSWLLEQSDLFT